MNIRNDIKIVIAGAGIGGLVTALSLHHAGFTNITLIESARTLRPLGLGISLKPEAIRILCKLGISSDLEKVAVQAREVRYMDKDGNIAWKHFCGKMAANEYPQLSIHRGALHMLLVSAVRRVLGSGALLTGTKIERVDQMLGAVTLQCRDQSTCVACSINADLLIGADGVDSVVRSWLHPNVAKARPSSIVMWRGAALLDHFIDGQTMTVTHDSKWSRLVAYPISKPHLDTGKVLVHWACLVPLERCRLYHSIDWNQPSGLDTILQYFSDWNLDWVDIKQFWYKSQMVLRHQMVDRDPLPFWSMGRVTLLGDAAHLMYPMGSNGASQAISDAIVLADSLSTNDRIDSALNDYESRRRDAVYKLVLAIRKREEEERATATLPLADKKVMIPKIMENYRLSTKDSRHISI